MKGREWLWMVSAAFWLAGSLFAADEQPPDWVKQAAAQKVAGYPAKVTTAVLFQEEAVTVDVDGRRVMRERKAVKILQPGGGQGLAGARYYNSKSGRIRDVQGWLIPPNGKPTTYAKNRVADVSPNREDTYDEYRMKVLECGNVPPGSVFAWEITEEEKSIFTQSTNFFQGNEPVLDSRFVLTVPAGWEVKGTVFNREGKLEPQVAGNTYTWELRDLGWLEREDYSPPMQLRAPWLAVTYFPPNDNRAGLQQLKDWRAVSQWVSQFVDPAAEVTPAVRKKAEELTANKASEMGKIRAIAAFAQQTKYVEIALNLTKGGGYTPRSADATLATNWGDCKDKATLMRALLKAVGIESYVTVIYSGHRGFVRPEWASPKQFNHAILAVRVSEAIDQATVFDAPGIGRLMMFDPTDAFTPVGDLPIDEQGSYALVLAGQKGALLKMPLLPVATNRMETSVEGTLNEDGQLQSKLSRVYYGQSGALPRAIQKLRGDEELKRRYERMFSRRIGEVSLGQFEPKNQPLENQFQLRMDLTSVRFAQSMQGRLLIVRPGMIASAAEYGFSSNKRSSPIELDASLRKDTVRIKMPAGFKLDELPRPARLETRFGTLEAKWAVENGEVRFDQTLEVKATTAAASEFGEVEDFFSRVNGALATPVVLARQ